VREDDLKAMAAREVAAQRQLRCRVLVCCGAPCLAAGAGAVGAALDREAASRGLAAEVQRVSTGCLGPCSRGPLVTVAQADRPDAVYERVTPEAAAAILAHHAAGGPPVPGHAVGAGDPFFGRQARVVLANCGAVDPERIEDAVARGGYAALSRALHEMTPEAVCREIVQSGLRGRGGAGYPTGLKWEMVRKEPGPGKYVVANGDEGDPGAYMDRTLMESDPHRVLEGMAIAAYAVGAERGFVYVRGEHPLAAQRLSKAIRDAERLGVLGSRLLGTGFGFRVDVRLGAGAYVCGEETALMASIMGQRGQPVPRPPYPPRSGLWGRPTLINNVETLGCVPAIVAGGARGYAELGTPGCRGTKVFALCGQVRNAGLVEVPMGTTLREIVFEVGGGIPDDRPFKAVQTGGPGGGCVPASQLDAPVDYEALRGIGSMMGSGGFIVLDDRCCMVDLARFFMDFCVDESCGKCVPCRAGTLQMHRILSRIAQGEAAPGDLPRLEALCGMVGGASLCGLGQNAPNPVLSTLRWFRDEYEAHVAGRCPAGVCRPAAEAGGR
jgi:bidirectional [NiFe] hydrogenase diaphorase subunit